MAQVGRISGPLLVANLERLGKTAGADQNLTFSDTAISSGGTPLLFVDVINSRIGINNNIPQYELDVTGTSRLSTTLDIDTQANIANLNFVNSSIQPFPGSLTFDSQSVITANNIQTNNLNIDFNRIQAITPNTNIELTPNGTGSVEVFANTNVYGNIDATGSITLAGNINFGDADTDNVTFNTDVASDIIPNLDGIYSLGTPAKRWQDIESVLMNGVDINTQVATVAGVDVNLAPGKTWFVAKNGDNTNVGDRQQGAFGTIEYALLQASAGDTVYVYPGEYEESCPLEVPTGVTITGHDQRNTIVYPASSQSTTDIFLLNGETLVQNLTIKDFYYDSVSDIGYAFRFATGGKVTTRSPYIQNITVLTKGSVLTSADPKGFDSGDAGKGILVDGSVLANDTREASMLFHAVTLITPGVDAITMTNGVRVEWLNSFTYFANRGLYATRGTGRVTDNLVTRYGAEIRSIGSANIYGNIGAEADGADTLMYLINHNWGYIGTGKDSSNDNTLAIQANEVIEINGGQIHFQSQAQDGDFRVGDNFLIDFAKGSQTFDINDVPVVGVEQITVTTGSDVTILDLDYIQTGNIRFIDNTVASITGDLNILSTTGTTNITTNVVADQNLYASGNLTIGGGLIAFGNNQAIDTVTFDSGIDSDLLPKTTDVHDIGSTVKQWRDVNLTEVYLDTLNITDNYIETIESNTNLELRANGTGEIFVDDSVTIENSLDVQGLATFQGNFAMTGGLTVNNITEVIGTLATQTSMSITDYLNVDGGIQSENILLDDNFITTTITNSNLELRASGSGVVSLFTNANIIQDLNVIGNIDATDVNTIVLTQSDSLNVNDISIQNATIQSSSNLILQGTQNIVSTSNVDIAQALTVTGVSTFDLVDPTDKVLITGLVTHTGDRNFTGPTIQQGNLFVGDNLTVTSDAQFEDISIKNNVVTTTLSNSDLELRAAGSGSVLINDSIEITNNFSVLGSTIVADINVTTQTDSPRFEISNVIIDDNFITTQSGDLILRSTAGSILSIPNNDVVIDNNFDSTSFTYFQGGVDLTGSLTHTGNKVQNGNVQLTGNFSISNTLTTDRKVSFENIDIEDNFITTVDSNSDLELRASGAGNVLFPSNNVVINNNLTIGLFTIDDNLQLDTATASEYTNNDILVDDNTITTTQSNADLTLRANGTGEIYVPSNNVQIDNNLDVSGLTDLQATVVNGTLTHVGDNTQGSTTSPATVQITGNMTVSGLLDVPNMDFENVLIDTNVITTVDSNSDLELRAAGTGIVQFQETLNVSNTATIGTLESSTIDNTGTVSSNTFVALDDFTSEQVTIQSNNITWTNGILALAAAGTGNIVFKNLRVEDNLDVSSPGITTLSDTEIDGSLTVLFDRTQTGNINQTGNLTINNSSASNGLVVDRQVQFENILIDDNIITTTDSNSNLELRANGNVVIPENVYIVNNFSGTTIDSDDIVNTGTITSGSIEVPNGITISGSQITTSTGDLTLSSSGTNVVEFNDNVSITDNLTSYLRFTNFADTEINGDITGANRLQLGNYSITGRYTVDGFANFDRRSIISDIKIEGNQIITRGANQNLVIESPGNGLITSVFSNVQFGQDLTVLGTINANGIDNATLVDAEEFNTGLLKIFDNNIDSLGTNTNIILSAQTPTALVRFIDSVEINNNLTINEPTNIQQLQNVTVVGNITHTGNTLQTGNMSITGDINISTLNSQSHAEFENIVVGFSSPTTIETTLSNSDLELVAPIGNNVIFDATTVNVTNGDLIVSQTLFSENIQNTSDITTATMTTGDVEISTDTIKTTLSNSDLELYSNSSINFLDAVTFSQNLNVEALSQFVNVDITGTITHTDNATFNDVNVTGDLNVSQNVTIAGEATFEGVKVGGNYISTFESNADLELQATGTGQVLFDTDTTIANNLAINGVFDINELTVENVTSAERFDNGNIQISDNRIQTTETNSNLHLETAGAGSVDFENININENVISSNSSITFTVDGSIDIHGTNAVKLPAGTDLQKTINTTGDIRFNTSSGLFEGFTTVPVSFSGIYSADRLTSVDATKNSNQIIFTVQGTQEAVIQQDNFFVNGIILPQLTINNNTIQVTQLDTDLTLSNGSGVFNIADITIEDSKIINNTNNALEIKNSGIGYYTVLASNTGVLVPSGPSADRTSIEAGDTRWNTDLQLLETFDGNSYVSSAGSTAAITPEEFDDLLFEYTLIFG